MSKNQKDTIVKRAVWEEKHHKTFDYKEKNKICQVCGELNGRHTYRCIHYDTDK